MGGGDISGMPLRWYIPLPGPAVRTPGRKRRKDPFRHVTDQQWERIGQGIADRVDRHHDRMGRAAQRIDGFTEQVKAADQRSEDRYRQTLARHAEIRQLPAWPRFKAAMGFPPRQR